MREVLIYTGVGLALCALIFAGWVALDLMRMLEREEEDKK